MKAKIPVVKDLAEENKGNDKIVLRRKESKKKLENEGKSESRKDLGKRSKLSGRSQKHLKRYESS